ncbi:hypothetical protein ACIA8M_15685 [Streptomyces anulatus]
MDRATAVWAVAYAGFGLVCVLWGTPLFHMGGAPASPALSWAVVGVGMLAAAASGAVTRYGRLPAVRVLLRVACVLAGCAAFGLLMDVITLMFGQGVDSVPVAANHALAAVGCLLLATTARAPQPSRPLHRALPLPPDRCNSSPVRARWRSCPTWR